MMNDSLERELADWPITEPTPRREADLMDALRQAASARHTARWWARPIPLWQAAAACVAMLLFESMWFRPRIESRASMPVPPVILRIDQPVFASVRPTASATRFATWKLLEPR